MRSSLWNCRSNASVAIRCSSRWQNPGGSTRRATSATLRATLPGFLHWRLFPDFRDRTAYLDIETTGLSGGIDAVTCIALYDGRAIRTYVQGQNLDDLCRRRRAPTTCSSPTTASAFDIPFLRASLGLSFDQVHIDLRYVLRRLGYRGGLKGCEKQLGIDRAELDGVDGFMAVKLWWEYQARRDPRALETLLSYNVQDVLNLETLLVMAYNLEVKATPFAAARTLPLPVLPPNPYVPDTALIRRLLVSSHFATR